MNFWASPALLCAIRGLLFFFVATALPYARAGGEEETVVVTVAGEPIVLGEFLLYLNTQRAEVYAHFQGLLHVEDTDRFWNSAYDGVTPWAFLKAKTLQDLKAIKVQEKAARLAGIVEDTSYASFQRRWEAENQRRAGATRRGEVIYGPRRVSAEAFYNEELARLTERLKNFPAGETWRASDEQARQYYERNKDRRYRLPDTISVEVLTWTIGSRSGGDPGGTSWPAVQSAARQGKSLAECATLLPDASDPHVEMCHIDQDTASQYGKTAPSMLATAATLQPGQVSEIIRSDAGGMILQCQARIPGGFLSYDRVAPAIRRDCLEEAYHAFVEQLVADAEVIINKPVYDGIAPSTEPVPAEPTLVHP